MAHTGVQRMPLFMCCTNWVRCIVSPELTEYDDDDIDEDWEATCLRVERSAAGRTKAAIFGHLIIVMAAKPTTVFMVADLNMYVDGLKGQVACFHMCGCGDLGEKLSWSRTSTLKVMLNSKTPSCCLFSGLSFSQPLHTTSPSPYCPALWGGSLAAGFRISLLP